MRISLIVLSFLVSACSPEIVYVYGDAGPQPLGDGGGFLGDAGPMGTDAALETDANLYPFACLTRADGGSVSQTDCARYADRPVCDGLVYDQHLGSRPTCEALPTLWCDACGSDDQCRTGVDIHADCVFIPHPIYPDQACLSPCTTDADCDFVSTAWGLPRGNARCSALPRGHYCTIQLTDSTPTCFDPTGSRRI